MKTKKVSLLLVLLLWSLMVCQALVPDSQDELEKWGANTYSEAPGNIKSGSNLEKVKWIAWHYGEYLNNNGESANLNLIGRGLELLHSYDKARMTCGDLSGKLDYILRGSGIFKKPDQEILFIQVTKQKEWYSKADVNFDHGVLAIIDKGQVYTFDLWMYANSHLAQFYGFRGSKWNGMCADDWEKEMKSLGYVNFAINGMEPISGSLHQLLVDSGRLTSNPADAETSGIAINGLARIMSTTGAYTIHGNTITGGPDLLGFANCLCSCGCSEAGWACGYNVVCRYEPAPGGDCLCGGFGTGHAPMSTSGKCYDGCASEYNIKEVHSTKTPLGPVIPGQGGTIETGDTLQTTGDAVILLQDGSKLLVKPNSILSFTSPKPGLVRVQLHKGDLRVSSPPGGVHGLEVQRGDKIIRPKGTEFICQWDGAIGKAVVVEGSISIANDTSQEITLDEGKQIEWPGDAISPYNLSTDDGGLVQGIPLRDLPMDDSKPEPFGDYGASFTGGIIPSDWLWQDPGSDALKASSKPNTLTITVPDGNDLWGHPGTTAGQRSDAPRLLHKVTGDFDLQGEVFMQTDAKDRASVEFLLYSPGAYLGLESEQMKQDLLGEHYRILGGGWLRTEGLDKLLSLNKPTKITYSGYYLKDAPNAPSKPVLLKLTRRGDVWKTYQSLDGKLWSLSSRQEINASETVWVGWVFKRLAYDDMTSEPAIFALKDVRLSTAPRDSLPISDWDMVIQAGSANVQGNSAQLSLDGSAPGTVSAQKGRSLSGDFDAAVSFQAEKWTTQPGEYRSLALVASNSNGQNRTYMNLAQLGQGDWPSQRYSTDLSLKDSWAKYASKNTEDFSGKLRIVRQGGNISTYYWSEGGWAKLGDFGTGFSDPAYLGMEISNEWEATANASLSVKFNVEEVAGAEAAGVGSTSGEVSSGQQIPSPSGSGAKTGTGTAVTTEKEGGKVSPKGGDVSEQPETVAFDNWNIGGVNNNPTCHPGFTISVPYMITYIDTYHWNYGKGTKEGGTIALQKDDGTEYGPWQTETKPGQGGVPNAYWIAHPNEVIAPGTYAIIDSDTATWSQNSESGGCGFSKVKGYPYGQSSGSADFTWIGMDCDKVGVWDDGLPDGSSDGHFRVNLHLPSKTEIKSIKVLITDSSETPMEGGVHGWSSADENYWILGVFENGRQLNQMHVSSLGTFSGDVELDVYCTEATHLPDWGRFSSGNHFLLEVQLGDGTALQKGTAIRTDTSKVEGYPVKDTSGQQQKPTKVAGTSKTIPSGKQEIAGVSSPITTQDNPQDAEGWYAKGYTLDKQGKYDEAIKAYDEAIKLDPQDANIWYAKGIDLRKQSRYDEAIKAYDEALRLNPQDANTWYAKGYALDSLGRYDEAIEAYGEATRINPQYASAWYTKGVDLRKQSRYDEAIKAYDEALRLDPRDAKAWYAKGYALNSQGKYEEAISAYDEVIKLNSQNIAEAWYAKGYALKALGRATEADTAFAKAKELGYVS